jgi:uracil-DNA glycosylase family 4
MWKESAEVRLWLFPRPRELCVIPLGMDGDFVARLASARIGRTFNQYAESVLRRERLRIYLEARADAEVVLVGEAAGYRGARVSGIAFTSERQLTGTGPTEASATIVHHVLARLGIEEDVLLWNAVPTHPGNETSNRAPRRDEVEAATPFLDEIVRGRAVIAVGRVAAAATGAMYVRHPSYGGAPAFEEGLERAFATIRRRRAGARRFL